MALQMEDVYDVVSTVYPHFDFVTQMDQSAGHGKKREGGLDVSMMRKKWGGKQNNMRSTITTDNGPYGATHLIGSVQHMHFRETDEGPFYVSLEQREM